MTGPPKGVEPDAERLTSFGALPSEATQLTADFVHERTERRLRPSRTPEVHHLDDLLGELVATLQHYLPRRLQPTHQDVLEGVASASSSMLWLLTESLREGRRIRQQKPRRTIRACPPPHGEPPVAR